MTLHLWNIYIMESWKKNVFSSFTEKLPFVSYFLLSKYGSIVQYVQPLNMKNLLTWSEWAEQICGDYAHVYIIQFDDSTACLIGY